MGSFTAVEEWPTDNCDNGCAKMGCGVPVSCKLQRIVLHLLLSGWRFALWNHVSKYSVCKKNWCSKAILAFLLQHPPLGAGAHALCVTTATPGSRRYWWRNGYWTGSCYACGVWVGPANSNYPSCPSCQYYDPNQDQCVTVDDCPAN